jgi:hypothetical protein
MVSRHLTNAEMIHQISSMREARIGCFRVPHQPDPVALRSKGTLSHFIYESDFVSHIYVDRGKLSQSQDRCVPGKIWG